MSEKSILIVDDDRDFSQLRLIDLAKKGYKVSAAFDGEEGLEKVRQSKPDLILLDIKMPKMDGYTFVRRLKKDEATAAIPVIVLTSYEPMKDMFQMEGVKDYYVKSANTDSLFDTIRQRIQGTNS